MMKNFGTVYSENAFRKLMNRNTSSLMAGSMFRIFHDRIEINERNSFVQV